MYWRKCFTWIKVLKYLKTSHLELNRKLKKVFLYEWKPEPNRYLFIFLKRNANQNKKIIVWSPGNNNNFESALFLLYSFSAWIQASLWTFKIQLLSWNLCKKAQYMAYFHKYCYIQLHNSSNFFFISSFHIIFCVRGNMLVPNTVNKRRL